MAIWPRFVYARARPIHGRGKLEVPKPGERVGFARARAPRVPVLRVDNVEAVHSRVVRDMRVVVSGGGRRWYTTSQKQVILRHHGPAGKKIALDLSTTPRVLGGAARYLTRLPAILSRGIVV